MFKCTEEEKAFLIKKLGEEKVNTLPWWDDKTGDDIAAELDFIIISEGMTPDQNFLTDIGIKYQTASAFKIRIIVQSSPFWRNARATRILTRKAFRPKRSERQKRNATAR